MEKVTTVGLDLAKRTFQAHGIDAADRGLRRKLRRSALLEFFAALQPALIGIEACSAVHH
ncbi:hypothetical protein JMJ56_31385 [Belnapia sp. T18]|uniref:Transposase n=1 Tax=Belnapia arida TaxID=2804533 RepID=A0ABS1UCR0_9PROT|nr:hypothetical protein [Belnapia arida]